MTNRVDMIVHSVRGNRVIVHSKPETNNQKNVTVHSVTSNTLRDAQKSCIRMISRRNSRVFCELCSQKTPRGMLPVNRNRKTLKIDNFSKNYIIKQSFIVYLL